MADALIRRVISPQAHVVAISSFIFAIFVLVKDESANDCIRKRQMERRRLEWSRTTTERSNIVAIFYHHFEAGIKKNMRVYNMSFVLSMLVQTMKKSCWAVHTVPTATCFIGQLEIFIRCDVRYPYKARGDSAEHCGRNTYCNKAASLTTDNNTIGHINFFVVFIGALVSYFVHGILPIHFFRRSIYFSHLQYLVGMSVF